MTRVLLSALVLALASMAVTANEVYRTVERDGTITYSDRPLSANSQLVSVAILPADPERAEAEAEARREMETGRRQQAAESAQLDEARAEQAEIKAAACRDARQKVEVYERSPRIYEPLPDGGRRYLSDEEMARARVAARQAVSEFCDD